MQQHPSWLQQFDFVTLDSSRLTEGFEKPVEVNLLTEMNELPKMLIMSLFQTIDEIEKQT
ncbi:MAG: hypothetical protein J4F41_04550 [Alphaproteobacteria bacterium]|nr:hypothetical protein [Alphaproteobacteria bacterium]